jgi:hypothetical protein
MKQAQTSTDGAQSMGLSAVEFSRRYVTVVQARQVLGHLGGVSGRQEDWCARAGVPVAYTEHRGRGHTCWISREALIEAAESGQLERAFPRVAPPSAEAIEELRWPAALAETPAASDERLQEVEALMRYFLGASRMSQEAWCANYGLEIVASEPRGRGRRCWVRAEDVLAAAREGRFARLNKLKKQREARARARAEQAGQPAESVS